MLSGLKSGPACVTSRTSHTERAERRRVEQDLQRVQLVGPACYGPMVRTTSMLKPELFHRSRRARQVLSRVNLLDSRRIKEVHTVHHVRRLVLG